jgi:Tol biopolymer transport system component
MVAEDIAEMPAPASTAASLVSSVTAPFALAPDEEKDCEFLALSSRIRDTSGGESACARAVHRRNSPRPARLRTRREAMRTLLMLTLVSALASTAAAAVVSSSTAGKPVCGPYRDLPREGAPVASGNGRVLAWMRWGWRDQRGRVFVSAPDGSAAVPVSVPPGARDDSPLALSPDGTEVLIYRSGDPSRYVLASTSASGSEARFVSNEEAGEIQRRWRTQTWSPDGRYRVEVEYAAVWVVSADGTERRRIASTELNAGAAWSPDGSLIAIGTDGDGLQVVKPDGTGLRRLRKTDVAQSPAWSPNGSWIAFEIDASTYKDGSSISVVRPDGSALRALTQAHQGPDQRETGGPSWVDDKTLVFSNYQHEHRGPRRIHDIHTIDVDGRNERRITYQCHLGTRKDDLLRGSLLGDTVRTYAGDDEVRPGPGADDVDAGPGDDFVSSRDWARDVVRCGPGRDRVLADRRDVVRGCEQVARR